VLFTVLWCGGVAWFAHSHWSDPWLVTAAAEQVIFADFLPLYWWNCVATAIGVPAVVFGLG
jgi:hypothetical protein